MAPLPYWVERRFLFFGGGLCGCGEVRASCPIRASVRESSPALSSRAFWMNWRDCSGSSRLCCFFFVVVNFVSSRFHTSRLCERLSKIHPQLSVLRRQW